MSAEAPPPSPDAPSGGNKNNNNNNNNNATLLDKLTPRITSGIATAEAWDADPSLLFECRAMIPFHLLQPELYPHMRQEEDNDNDDAKEYMSEDDDEWEGDDLLLKRLTKFFKRRVMKWMNSPNCTACGRKDGMKNAGVRGPETQEEREGGASRVEMYHCPTCDKQTTVFPRYNSPRKLLETRTGRCGEWANLFGLYCRAAGFETRYCTDFTDHVWVEVYSTRQQRWIHADSCEGVIDKPSMYEAGWGKKLNYILGITTESVVDVTRRYTRNFDTEEFQARRRTVCGSEPLSTGIILRYDGMQRSKAKLGKARMEELDRRAKAEQEFFARGQKLGKWMKGEEYKEGRLSGSLAWRALRNELGEKTEKSEGEGSSKETNASNKTSVFFHVESFHPNPSIAPADITQTSDKKDISIAVKPPSPTSPRTCIVVSGVPCAVGLADMISVVVVDECSGCILQSRCFDSWDGVGQFIHTVPDDRIVAICGVPPSKDDVIVSGSLSRLGGLELTPSSVSKENKDCLLYIGQVNRHPEWANCSTNSAGFSVTIKDIPFAPLKLRTERNTVPHIASGRLPETVMPLRTQMLANEDQKRTAFLSFMEGEGAEKRISSSTGECYIGYTTRTNAPIYLVAKTGFPFQRFVNDGANWNTFHYLPEQLVPDDDNGILEVDTKPSLSVLKFDIPVDTSFFETLLGSYLLVKTGGTGTHTPLDTASALQNTRLVALYFSAHWCPPCRKFTPLLCEMYTHLKEEVLPTHGLEIIFVSSDRDPNSFAQYYGTMPWLAVPFENELHRRSVGARFGVRGIPALVVLDAMSGQVVVTKEQSRSDVMRACQGGDDAIENLLKNQWLTSIPQESKAIMETLELSCNSDEEEGKDDSGLQDGATPNPYLVRKIPIDETKKEALVSSVGNNQPTQTKSAEETSNRIKEIFAALVAEGIDPTAAAAKAIEKVAQEQELQASLPKEKPKLDAGPLDDCGELQVDQNANEEYAGYLSPDIAAAKVEKGNTNGKAAVRNVVSTAKKYLDNVEKNPSNPRFRTFKLSNKVFDRITSTVGGVDLILSLGFSVYCTETDFLASIPLAADLDQMGKVMTGILEKYSED